MDILEEDFNDPEIRHRHYLQHVAKDWGDFYSSLEKDENGYINPKFPPTMTESQYEQAANDLATASAGPSSSMTDPIIGFKVKDKKSGKVRNEKIRKTSRFVNANRKFKIHLMDVVVYKIENGKPVIISFMLSKTNKIYRELQHKVSELDESMSIEEAFTALRSM